MFHGKSVSDGDGVTDYLARIGTEEYQSSLFTPVRGLPPLQRHVGSPPGRGEAVAQVGIPHVLVKVVATYGCE